MNKQYSLKEAKEYQRITQNYRASQEFYDRSYNVVLVISLLVGAAMCISAIAQVIRLG